jgi:hypothetical protein
VQIGNLQDISADLYALACQPDKRVRVYSACIVDGVGTTLLTGRKIGRRKTVGLFPRENMTMSTLISTVSSKASSSCSTTPVKASTVRWSYFGVTGLI